MFTVLSVIDGSNHLLQMEISWRESDVLPGIRCVSSDGSLAKERQSAATCRGAKS